VLTWFAFWTLVGLGFATLLYLAERRFTERPLPWLDLVRTSLPDWYGWGLFALLVVELTRRAPIARVTWGFNFALHVAMSLLAALVHLALVVPLQWGLRVMVGGPFPLLPRLADHFAASFLWNVTVYWAILGVAQALEYRREREAQRLRAARLETQLAQARLQALTLELRPHFLFNALNALAELIHEDPDAAERMVQRLGDLLRRTLETDGAREVPLERELALADGYLSVEAVRFQDRLTVDYDVASDARAGSVPAMILLPLVENAVRHGLARRRGGGPGRVGIRARRAADRLELEVWDDGPGLAAEPQDRQGVGLANTRARLEQMYGEASVLELLPREPTGLRVRIMLPFRAAA
jgi:LytS/YehU family sensor histidine kinase